MEHEVEMQGGAGDPAQAFEELRAEVADVRRAVAALPRMLAANRPPAPHDYRSDIGKVAQGLGAVVGRLNEIEKHPALRLTPEAYSQAIARAGTSVMSEAGQKLATATQKINRTGDQLASLIGTMRGRDEQRSRLIYTGLGAFVVALFAGLLGAPYLASVFLPIGMESNVAAIVMNNDRWDAGITLMQTADPQRWNGAVNAWQLVHANQDEINACVKKAEATGKDQRCIIITKP
jgi:Family of unknown function (DUF6118)